MLKRFSLFLILLFVGFSLGFSYDSKEYQAFKLFEKAKFFYEQGEYEKAKEFLIKAIEILPNDGNIKIKEIRKKSKELCKIIPQGKTFKEFCQEKYYDKECKIIPIGRTFKKICKPNYEEYYKVVEYYPNKLLNQILASASPPYIKIEDVVFIDENKNNIFEAGEKAKLIVRISNIGKGKTPKDTKLKIFSNIFGEKVVYIGEILPGAKIEKVIDFIIPLEVKTSIENLNIEVLAQEYSPKPITKKFATKGIHAPEFRIVYRIDDDNMGESIGNNNGIIDPRETIELHISIENMGIGIAKGVEVILSSQEVEILRGIAKIGDLPPGAKANDSLVFFVPAYNNKKKITFSLEVHDALGLWKSRHILAFNIKRPGSKIIELAGNTVLTKLEESSLMNLARKNFASQEEKCVKKYPNRYLLAIGEINYVDQSQSSLEFVEKDLEIMKKLANCYMGVPKENIFIYKDLTYARFKRIIRKFSKKIREEDATIIVYYSGHGIMHTSGEFYLLPIDADISTEQDMLDSSIPLSFLEQKLGQAKGKKVFILDACRIKVAWKPAFMTLRMPNREDMAFLLATQEGGISYGLKTGTSAFTAALWKLVKAGIKNLDLDGSGYIEIKEIKRPLILRVKEIITDQTPEIIGYEDIKLFPLEE